MSDPAICGRHGCKKSVSTGMACDLCHTWYHPNCTGLTEDQYVNTEAQDLRFHCAVCVHQQMVKPEMVSKQDATTNTIDDGDAEQHPHTSTLNMAHPIESFLSDFACSITEKLEEISKKQLELSSQIFKLGSVLPLCTTAQEVHRLSSQEVVEASLSLKDQLIRERRLILWGTFQKGTDPSTTAQKVITSVCESIKGNCVVAQWFRAKRSKSIRGILVSLPSCDHVAEVVSKRLLILGKYSNIRNVSLDYPRSQRVKQRCSEPPTLPPSDMILSSPKVLLTPLKPSQMYESSASPVSPILEEVAADSRESSRMNDTAEEEDTYVKPVSRSCSPPSPRIFEALKPKSKTKSRAPKNEASSSAARPSLPTFKKSKKGILGNPVNINLFSGNQVTTPLKSARGPVSKSQDQNFRKRSRRKRPLRRSKIHTNPPPATCPPTNIIFDLLSFLTSRSVPTPLAIPTNKQQHRRRPKTKRPPRSQ